MTTNLVSRLSQLAYIEYIDYRRCPVSNSMSLSPLSQGGGVPIAIVASPDPPLIAIDRYRSTT